MSRYFNEYIRVAPFSHALWRSTEADIIEKITLPTPLLDVGCGFGEFANIFFKEKVDTGLDISEKDLKKAEKSGIYLNTVLGDARKLPFKNLQFKSCISISVLEHIEHPEKVINEVYRVLEDSGVFVFSVPTSSLNKHLIGTGFLKKLNLEPFAKTITDIYHKAFLHNTIVKDTDWIDWVKNAGFREITVINSLTPSKIRVFQLFLLSGGISQLVRKLTGERGIVNSRVRTELLTKLNKYLTAVNEQSDASNIVIVAKK